MECLKCGSEIGKCKTCPFCGYEKQKEKLDMQQKNICKRCGKQGEAYFEEMCKQCYEYSITGKYSENEVSEKKKSSFLFIFKMIILILSVISILIILIILKDIIITIVLVLASAFLWIMLTIFETIIDLLESINKKLD